MPKRLLANLGFLLQISGLMTILPIGIGLFLDEIRAVVALFLACAAFLSLGFLLNALCERKDLDFKSSNFLFLATFIVLPLIGALPFFYFNPFNSTSLFDIFTNGVFESVSGFTTTGFSFIATPETLPYSLLVYRSLTELMGGVGVVFLLLAFFQSRHSLNHLSYSVGIDNVCGSLKKTYISVFAIYAAIVLTFTGLFVALGFTNVIRTGTFVIDVFTGGFSPTQLQPYLSIAPKSLMMLLMLLGALNFGFIYSILVRKFRKELTQEAILFFLIILVGTLSLALASQIGTLDALFHIISMSSSAGYSYIPLSSFGQTGFSIIVIILLIGGCTFSMAGGIRVSRLLSFAKSSKEAVMGILFRENALPAPKRNTENGNGSLDNLSASVSILFFIIALVILAVIFTTSGVSFSDAIFEVGSALTTNGISMGATTVTMGVGYKWVIIIAMTIGRVEMLSILLALFTFGQRWFSKSKSNKSTVKHMLI